MASTIPVEYVGPFDQVEIATTGLVVKQGETVELYPNLAGRAPSGDPGEDGYDPGEGLLAQVDTWRQAKSAKSKPVTTQEA
jgi:hypothetical protein